MRALAPLLLAGLAALALSGCADGAGAPADAPVRADESGTADSPSAVAHRHDGVADAVPAGDTGTPADMSVYNLESEWTDAEGVSRTLGDALGGRVQVVALVYTSCAFACPAVIADMKRIEAAVPDAGFVLVSIDPARDTPERLRSFARGSRLSAERWTLLTAADDDLLELAAVLGVRYRRISDTDFMHSNMLTVLDAEGRIVHRQLGLGRVAETIAAIRRL